MATLNFAEMPTSFTGEALARALQISWPTFGISYDGLSFVRVGRDLLIGYLLSVYCIGVAILCSPLGVCYHGISALGQKTIAVLTGSEAAKARANALAREHAKAMGKDLVGLFLVAFAGISLFNNLDDASDLEWWFSSSLVRTNYDQNHQLLFLPENKPGCYPHRLTLLSGQDLSLEQCPYNEMRSHAARANKGIGFFDRSIAFNSTEILRKICLRKIPNEARNPSRNFVFPHLALEPSNLTKNRYYSVSADSSLAKRVSSVVSSFLLIPLLFCFLPGALIGAFIIKPLVASIASALLSGGLIQSVIVLRFLLLPLALLIAGLFLGTGLKWLSQIWNSYRREDEFALSQRLTQQGSSLDALCALRKAALSGNPEAQQNLGLVLLASVFPRSLFKRSREEFAQVVQTLKQQVDNQTLTREMLVPLRESLKQELSQIDSFDLKVIYEAVSWLRAASINGYYGTEQCLESMFFFLPDSAFRPIEGVTEEERMRSALEGFGSRPTSFDQIARVFKQSNLEPLSREMQQIHEKIRGENLDQALVQTIEQPTFHMPPDLYRMIREYIPFFYDRTRPLFEEPAPVPHP